MESRESQRDKRVQDVINGRPSGGGDSPTASAMRAREEIQGIEAERSANLERQKIINATRQQQMATMKQAALLGASGMAAADAPVVSPLAQQAAAMNPQTQAILQKYGVKPGPKTTTITTQQSGPNIRTTNTTNNNVRNEIKIVQPQIPMRQQQIAIAPQGKAGNLDKFKAWLDSSFAKQANEYEVQQKEYRKREWNLARNSSRLFQKLSESTKSLGEKMDPRNMGATFGGQLKTLLFLFLATTIDKWWNPLMKKIASFEAGFRTVFGLPVNADLERGGAEGLSFVNKIKEFIGIDTKSEKGKNTSLLEGFKNVFTDGIDRLIETLKLFVEDRRLALQKINLPEFQLPKTDWNPLGNMIGSAFKGVMGPTTEYLGKILSALMGGTKGLQSRAASNLSSQAKETFKKEYGGRYFTSNSTDFMGNLKDDSTYGMSMLMSNNLSDRSNTLHTGGLMTGMKMLEGNAKKSGGAVINPALLKQLGFGESVIMRMIQSGQAEYVPYKLIKVPKTSAESDEYTGGSWGSYVGNEILDNLSFGLYGKFSGWGAKKAAAKGIGLAGKAGNKGLVRAGQVVAGTSKAVGAIGRLAGPAGWTATLGGGLIEGTADYLSASEGNSNFVYKAVPISDKRPGEPIRLLRITPDGFNTLKKEAKVESFDSSDVSFQRWIEGRERARKAIMGVKGKLVYQNSSMNALNQANTLKASYDAKMHQIWHDPNYFGRGGVGTFVDARDNTAKAVASGLSWAANGLNDIKYRMTGSISPLHIPPGEARRNAERGIKYLMDKYSLSKEAAAGIAGVIQRESGWNPGAQNQQEKAKGLKYGRGLCQWSNDWGVKAFPDWYQATYGSRKYPDEVPIEHQLDYLMTGLAENGTRKEEFLKVIHKPGVTVEEATRAMLLGYENGGRNMASFSDLAKVKAYGGVAGVNKMYSDRASAALGFYNIIGGTDGAGYNQTTSGTYTFDEDAIDDGQTGLWKVKYSMTAGTSGGWDMSGLQLADPEDIKATLIGQEVTDNLMLGDWFVGRSIRYLVGNASPKSTGYCARHIRLALKAGGINDSNHPAAATDYLHYLPSRGFARIHDRSQLQAGDICVQPAGGSHMYGHICMFTGKVWVSDFIQKNMIVYNGGKWPSVLFRYTGKGGSGSGSLIDTSQNFIETGLDGVGNFIGYAANALGTASDYINPETDLYENSINPLSLNTAQRATYEWAKRIDGVQEDKSGLYIDDTKNGYRHYIDLNSGISKTGLLTQTNIQGTYKLQNGVAFEAVNDTLEADVLQNSILSTVAGKLSKLSGTGKVLDYTLPGEYGVIGGKARENQWPIRYNLYEIAGDGTGFNTVLVPTIPLIYSGGTVKTDNNGNTLYPPEYELTGTPKSGWSILYSREFKIKSNISGIEKQYEWSPYLKGVLKIDITPEAMEKILDILRMIRGELEMSSELEGKIGDIRDAVKKEGAEFLKTTLGINEESINEAIEKHKKGEEADRFKKDVDGNIIDTKLGIEIYNAETGYIQDSKKFLENLGPDLSEYINGNLKKLVAQEGSEGVTAGNSYERYQALHANDIFKNPEAIQRLKEKMAGDLGYSVSARWNLLDRMNMSPVDRDNSRLFSNGKFKAILDKNGNQRYVLDTESFSQDLLHEISSRLGNEDYRNLTNFGLTSQELWDKLKIQIDDNRKKNIDWSNFESILKSGLLDRDKLTEAKDNISIEEGLKNLFELDDTKNRIKGLLNRYEESKKNESLEKDGFSEKNGYLIHTDSETGRSEAFGKVTENGVAGIENPEEYSNANFDFIKNPSEKSKYFDFKDKTSWYASKFGAKPLGSTGRMYIDIDKDTRYVFNANQLGYDDNIESLIKGRKGEFFNRVNGNGDKEYFSDGNWLQADADLEPSAGDEGFASLAADKIYRDNIEKLRKNQEDWNSEENQEIRRQAFNNSWNAQILEDRIKQAAEGGVDESNAYLGSIEDINKNQLDLLGIIANNTAPDEDSKKEIKARLDELTKLRTLGDVEKEKKRNAAIRDAFYDALKQAGQLRKGENEKDIFYSTRETMAKALGISVKDIQNATGIQEYGNYSKGIIQGKSPAQAAADAKKLNDAQTTNVKADAANIKAQTEIQKVEAKVVKTQSETTKIQETTVKKTAEVVKQQEQNAEEERRQLEKRAEMMSKTETHQLDLFKGLNNDQKVIYNQEGSNVTINIYNKNGFNPSSYGI